MTTNFADWSQGIQAGMEAVLGRLLPPPGELPQQLHEAMHYAALGRWHV